MILKRGPVYVYALAGGGKGKGVTSTSSLQEDLIKNLTLSCFLMHLVKLQRSIAGTCSRDLSLALELPSDSKDPGAGSHPRQWSRHQEDHQWSSQE